MTDKERIKDLERRVEQLEDIFKRLGISGDGHKDQIAITITHGTPYNQQGELISREALKEQVKNEVCEVCFDSPDERQCSPNCKLCTFKQLIDNAPTVPIPNEQTAWEQGYEVGLAQGKQDRPQGECRTCIHRDPEDKKCDCGAQERQGCPFPVSDDYFCKFYEKDDKETTFDDYLKEQLKDPEFRKEWENVLKEEEENGQ